MEIFRLTSITTERRRALQLSSFLLVFFAIWTLRATLFYAIDQSIDSLTLRAAYSDLLKFVLWVLPAAAFAFWLRNAPPAKYLGLSIVPNRRQWLWSLAITVIFLLAVAAFELSVGRKTISKAGLFATPLLLGLLQLALSPLLEEILFRGLVMKELLSIVPAYLSVLLASLLFVGAHLPFWLSHGGLNQALLANALGVFVFSAVACWLFQKTASIWPPTFAHMANNFLSSLLIAK